ncbi:hypothetical protein RJT34_17377 [Clitoria ternatea]|uniref:Pentatricopeptide repeat-containing protein n=1 Tax=Clitoria ternatea TaxID=43366 RepID=A0AAN9J993_CLITE
MSLTLPPSSRTPSSIPTIKGSFSHTLSVFVTMTTHGSLLDSYTFPSVVKAYSTLCRVLHRKSLHGSTFSCSVDQDIFVGTNLINMYGKHGEIGDARKVFDQMLQRNMVSWTAMVVGYVTIGDVVEAKKVFDVMSLRNVAS